MKEDFIGILLLIFTTIIFAIFLYKRNCNNTLTKLFFLSYTGYWMVSLTISLFNPMGLKPVSFDAYALLILNVIGYIIGFCMINETKVTLTSNRQFEFNLEHLSKNALFIIVLLISLFICYQIYEQYKELILLGDSRTDAVEIIAENNKGFIAFIFAFVLPPIYFCSIIISSFLLIYKRKLIILIPSILFIVFYSFIGGGRAAYFNIAIGLFFAYILRGLIGKKNLKLSVWFYITTLVLLGILYITMSCITGIRYGYSTEFSLEAFKYGAKIMNEQFVTYSLLPFRLFDYAINHNYFDTIGNNYGFTTFDSLNRYAWMFFKQLHIDIPLISQKVTGYLQNTWISVGTDLRANYAYTNAMYFYLDFKGFGILIFSFLFGLYTHIMIKQFYKHPTLPCICLLYYLYYILLQSVFTWHLNKPYSLAFIVLMTYYSFKKSKNKNKHIYYSS